MPVTGGVGSAKFTSLTDAGIDNLNHERIGHVSIALQKENHSLKQFIANEDALLIKRATSGLGTDEEVLVEVLCNRTKAQLEMTSIACVGKYGKTLRQIVDSDVSGSFGKMISYALMDIDDYGAYVITKATKGMGTDVEALIDLVNTKTNAELAAIKLKWEAQNDKGLVDCLSSELGTFSRKVRKVLINQFQGKKSENTTVDNELAKEQAKKLYKAGVGKLGTDEAVFIDILTTQSRAQIQAIKKEYELEHSMSLKHAIKKEMKGDLENALVALLHPSTPSYIAMAMRKSFLGVGTDFDRICRLLGGTDKSLMAAVNESYLDVYGKTLQEAIKSEALIVGDFRKASLAWVGGFDPTNSMEYAPLSSDLKTQAKQKLKEREGLKDYCAKRDAIFIKKACQGVGTDNNALVSTLCSRNKEHLARVDRWYHKLHGKSLIDEIKSETSGYFRKFLIAIVQPYDDFDAYIMKKACDGIGTNEQIIIECLAPRTNARIEAMKAKYDAKHDKALIDRLNSELSGHFKKIIIGLLKAQRAESAPANLHLADRQAKQLYDAGVARWGTDEDVFIEVFVNSSREHIQAVKEQYERMYAQSMRRVIEKETSGDLENVLVSMLYEPHEYFARQLSKAFKGIGTNEEAVIRVLGSHDKNELALIAEHYLSTYGRTINESLKSELSGNFKTAALTWVGVPDPMDFTLLKDALLATTQPSNVPDMDTKITIELNKGEVTTLSPELMDLISIGLGWHTRNGAKVDLDAGVLMFNQYGAVRDAVFFGKKETTGVSYSGDNRSGVGEGDDEQILLQLSLLAPEIHILVFTVHCYHADATFADVTNSYARVVIPSTGHVCAMFRLGPEIRTQGVAFAMMKRSPRGWAYYALGQGIPGNQATHPECVHAVKHIIANSGVRVSDINL